MKSCFRNSFDSHSNLSAQLFFLLQRTATVIRVASPCRVQHFARNSCQYARATGRATHQGGHETEASISVTDLPELLKVMDDDSFSIESGPSLRELIVKLSQKGDSLIAAQHTCSSCGNSVTVFPSPVVEHNLPNESPVPAYSAPTNLSTVAIPQGAVCYSRRANFGARSCSVGNFTKNLVVEFFRRPS